MIRVIKKVIFLPQIPEPVLAIGAREEMGKVGLAPVIGMMMAECAQVGLMFAGKAAMSDGMSNLVFVFYSKAFASLVLLPASLLFHRLLILR